MSIHEEIEIKFILPLSRITEAVDLKSLPVQNISQSYFSRSFIRTRMIPLIKKLKPEINIPEGLDYKNGRVRSVEKAGKKDYFVTLKGPREGGFSRLEIEIPIAADLYMQLLDEADRGTVAKQRYFLEGELESPDSRRLPVTAEIDLVTEAAGRPLAGCNVPEFAIVEIEVQEEHFLKSLQEGKHSFDFLKGAVEVRSLERSIQKLIRMRDLARSGITDQVIEALTGIFNQM
jgi:hypothetical protein